MPDIRWSGRVIVGAIALGTVVYLMMVLGPLAELEQITGSKPFDLRPGGYSHDSARDLINALGQEGSRIYLWRQIPLDTVYPALFAISVAGSINWLSGRFAAPFRRWFRAAATAAYFAAFADYVENAMIVAMLTTGSDLSPSLTQIASAATIFKSVLTTLSVVALLLAAILSFAVKLKRSGNPD